jgi:prolyl oligopeptidase
VYLLSTFVSSTGLSHPTYAITSRRDVLLVGADTGEGSTTTSGYPRTVREWTRGSKVDDSPIIFEVDATDVSCGQYLYDETHREGGAMYEVQSRSMSFYNSLYYVRMEPTDTFVKLAVAMNTEVSFFGRWMMLRVKADWEANENGSDKDFKSGSLIYVDARAFLDFSSAKERGNLDGVKEMGSRLEYHVLFEPTDSMSYAGYSTTKNYLILYTLDDVKERLKFFKIGETGGPFSLVYGDDEGGQIRAASAGGVDSKESDLIWLTTSSYTQPSTLYLADASKCGTDDFILSKLKSLPQMVCSATLLYSTFFLRVKFSDCFALPELFQFDSSELDVSQHFATSNDGTKVP